MSIPTNREEFSSYCLRKLGDPVIQINVAVEQVEDRIDEALYKFYERNYQAVEEVYILHDITTPEEVLDSNGAEVLDSNGQVVFTTGTDTEQGFILMPNDIVGVTNVFRPNRSSGLYSTEYEFHMNQLYSILNPTTLSGGGISYYYMWRSHLTLINRFFNPERSFNFNPITKRVTVAGGLKDTDRKFGGLVIRAFRKIKGEQQTDDPVGSTYHNIWQTKWLQDYATALIQRQWAQNLSKYQQVSLIGGVTMNGDQLMQQAMEEIQRLEEQLALEYEYPPSFIVG